MKMAYRNIERFSGRLRAEREPENSTKKFEW
jgi:hypothetical protein